MDWPIVEVVIRLAFLLFLLSVIASAVNEAIAGMWRLRARDLEKGISNLLTGSTSPSESGKELVDELYSNTLINGYGKDKHKPSYVSSRSFRSAVLGVSGLLEATSKPSEDPLQAEALRTEVQEKIDAISNESLKQALTGDLALRRPRCDGVPGWRGPVVRSGDGTGLGLVQASRPDLPVRDRDRANRPAQPQRHHRGHPGTALASVRSNGAEERTLPNYCKSIGRLILQVGRRLTRPQLFGVRELRDHPNKTRLARAWSRSLKRGRMTGKPHANRIRSALGGGKLPDYPLGRPLIAQPQSPKSFRGRTGAPAMKLVYV